MENKITVRVELSKEENYRLMIHMAKMKLREKRTKANEIIRLMQLGLTEEERHMK